MTAQARLVLSDCREARSELVDGVQGSEWRRRWAGLAALLRIVLHVLDKVDKANGSPQTQQVIGAEWDRLKTTAPEPKIFWEFIEQERNSILKEYRSDTGQGVTVHLEPLRLGTTVGGEVLSEFSSGGPRAEYHYVMNDGPFKGRDPRDLADEAIAWLEAYLDQIDSLGA